VLIVEAGQSAGGVVAVVIAIFAAAVIFVLLASGSSIGASAGMSPADPTQNRDRRQSLGSCCSSPYDARVTHRSEGV
jgi:hypothetical protein